MTIEHKNISDTELHEPKGVSSAAVGKVYVSDGAASGSWENTLTGLDTAVINDVYHSDGAGSGSWVNPNPHIGGSITFDSVTPAYTLATGGAVDVVINPTFVGTHSQGFTALTSPNARFRYDGTEDMHAFVDFNASTKQSSGGTIDVEIVLYKNGVSVEGSRVVRSATSGSWGSVTLGYDIILSTNDYLEFFLKTPSGAATILFAHAYAKVTGTIEL